MEKRKTNISLLGRKSYTLSNGLKIHIPTVNEIRGENDYNEIEYFKLTTPFVCTSTDFMVDLYDKGIDFQTLDDDYAFCASLIIGNESEKDIDYSKLFEGANACNFEVVQDVDGGGSIYIFDKDNGIIIDRGIYEEISNVLCKMHFRKKEHRRYSNKKSLEKAVEFEKDKIKIKQMNKKSESDLDSLILFLCCNANCKYDFETIGNLTIYDFYSSLRQIQKNEHVDNLFLGGYTGNIDLTKISESELDKFKI